MTFKIGGIILSIIFGKIILFVLFADIFKLFWFFLSLLISFFTYKIVGSARLIFLF